MGYVINRNRGHCYKRGKEKGRHGLERKEKGGGEKRKEKIVTFGTWKSQTWRLLLF